ncbi:MAG: CHAT domain-containing protein [Coleofasciculaceae cyanobacterium SM2_1_6]|nr:CHAT domain-containing protein [Coleofasciculaceae cyanobacterium SM2_1_6]
MAIRFFNANSQLLERGESSLPPCPKLVANIRDWQKAYRADVTHPRLEILQESITNSSDINHEELIHNLKKNLNDWLNSPEFLPLKESLIARLSRDEVVLVGIDINDRDLKYAPWHLWNFFEYFPKADFALLSHNSSGLNSGDRQNKRVRSNINIMAIIGDSRGINTTEDTMILKNLPYVNHPQILSEPSRQEVIDALWNPEPVDILFFAGHGKEEDHKGRICINNNESLSVKEIEQSLEQQIQKGLQLAIFNSCDGLELGEAIADLHIPQAIVMKEAVPDAIAQRFLKDFLAEFSQGVSLVQALRQTRNKLKDREHDYPYASWLPVLYCNPTEPLMQWSHPQPPFLQKYLWQAKIAASIVLLLLGLHNLPAFAFSQIRQLKNHVLEFATIPFNKVYQDEEFQLNYYPQTWQVQQELDKFTGDMASILLLDNREVRLTVNIRDLTSAPLTLEGWQQELLELLKSDKNLTIITQKEATLALRPGREMVFTTTDSGKNHKKLVVTALKITKPIQLFIQLHRICFINMKMLLGR